MKTHTLDKYLLQNLIDFNNKYHDERSVKKHEMEIAQFFEENYACWEKGLGLRYQSEDVEEMLGCALCTYSAAIDCDVFFDIKRLRMLRKWIEHYEKKVKFYCGLKAGMFNIQFLLKIRHLIQEVT